MRVLDLGGHDGFISSWIGREARKHGIELHIDGIEANSEAVSVANRRLADHDIAGETFIGMAEDAPGLLPTGSYDAVICFELIEHVKDMSRLLSVCELMCAPGARVYLSTPDGVFGQGQNPHHLRTLRVIDLAELCRRRGKLMDLRSGPDGIAFASYEPFNSWEQERPELAIWTGPAIKDWNPGDIEEPGGLGGSETAAVRVADALQKRGYTVTVYGQVNPQGVYRQVSYRHFETFNPQQRRDVVIASRAPQLLAAGVNARRTALWIHDTDYGTLPAEMLDAPDVVLALSTWHRVHLQDLYPEWAQRIQVIPNGIQAEYFTDATFLDDDIVRQEHRAIYTSSPDRGLDLLLKLWPRVREKLPEAELCFAYADVYGAAAARDPRLQPHRDLIASLSEQEGVVNMGSLSQPDVAAAMLSSALWLAPSFCTPAGKAFHETYCIGAVEAAAAGCYRVMSGWGALLEREEEMRSAWVFDSDEQFREDRWVEAIVESFEYASHVSLVRSKALAATWTEAGRQIDEAVNPSYLMAEAAGG